MIVIIISPLYISEQCYNEIPLNYLENRDTEMYVDPITRRTFEHANDIFVKTTMKSLFPLTQILIKTML